MNWIKKQWKKLSALLTALIIGGGIVVFNNGKHATMAAYQGRHLLAPDFGAVYANQGRQIQLMPGQRYIQIGIVLDSGKVLQAFADTLDTDVKIGVLAKFIQCRK